MKKHFEAQGSALQLLIIYEAKPHARSRALVTTREDVLVEIRTGAPLR